jgi:ABC-type bacteriocin/lantibiotic exporter with double-glycine peptidase domain
MTIHLSSWSSRLTAALGRHLSLQRRVPVLQQFNSEECGAACLAMILSYYGRPTRVAECRELCDGGRDGLTAQRIATAAQHFALRVTAYTLEPEDISQLRLPAILHWQFNHFVVIEQWAPTGVDIVDPAIGRRRVTTAEFDTAFTGVVLTFEPAATFETRPAQTQQTWRDYMRALSRTPEALGFLGQILGASLVLQILGLGVPVLTQILIDQVLPYQEQSVLSALGIGIGLLVASQMTVSYLRSLLLIHLRARHDTQLMLAFLEHLFSLPLPFFRQRQSGDLLLRLSSNSLIRETLTHQTITIVLDGSFMLVYLILLVMTAPWLGSVALAFGAVQAVLILNTSPALKRLVDQDLTAQADAQTYLIETLAGITTLKAAGAETRALKRWSDLFFRQLAVSIQRGQLSTRVEALVLGLRLLAPLALLWIGVQLMLSGDLSLGTMLALNAMAAAFLAPLTSLLSTAQQLQMVGAHLERLADVLQAEPEQSAANAHPAPKLTGRIDVEHLSFRYHRDAAFVLHDINLSITPGQKVAIVGRTGSGKSTLALLLLGLYRPAQGEILYDNQPLSAISYRSLRNQCGVVLQEAALFGGSLRQNIAYYDPGMDLAQIMWAAQQAEIHADIVAMPMGYETRVAERGGALSGGQRQRLALARALAHQPALLILDEATSHLDVLTEQQVDANLSRLACTRIVIAHRLSTVRNADQILVIEQGQIVERGRHAELLARNGAYARLVQHSPEPSFDIRADDMGFSSRAELVTPNGFLGLTAAGRNQNHHPLPHDKETSHDPSTNRSRMEGQGVPAGPVGN